MDPSPASARAARPAPSQWHPDLVVPHLVRPATAPVNDVEPLRATLSAASHEPHALLAWLIDAFNVFATPELAAMLVSSKEQVVAAGVIAANHEDRRVRRRLRDLLQRLAERAPELNRAANDACPPPARPPGHDRHDDDPSPEPALAALAGLVRPLTERRRTLFVSNRHDAGLERRLVELLRVELTTCDGTLRRVQAQCSRLAHGSYDLVLSATGFQMHGVDGALSRAAGLARIPYVRVNRGRPLTVLQAIAREFGVMVAGSTARTA